MFWRQNKQTETVNNSGKLEHVYTDGGGRKWYMYKNPLDMPKVRFSKLCEAERYAELKITKEYLSTTLDKMIEYGNQGKLIEMGALAHELKQRNELIAEFDSTLRVVALVYLLEGEDPDIYNDHIMTEKLTILSNDYKAQAFFLSMYQQLYLKWKQSLATDIMSYFRATSGVTKYLNRLGRQE